MEWLTGLEPGQIAAISAAGLFFAFIIFKLVSKGKSKGTTRGTRDSNIKQKRR